VQRITTFFLVVVLATGLGGCGALLTPPPAPASAPPLLNRDKAVFVAMSEDGHSASQWYVGSGRVVAYAVANAFSRRGVPVCLSDKQVKNDDIVATALRARAAYAVRPVITRWDQRNEWLGRPGNLTINISIIEVASARVVSSASINGFSYVASAILATPDELLSGPLSQYLSALY
jgi:hypothetical protein